MVIVNPENCAADAQLQLLQQTVSSGVRKRFTVIAKEPLLASVSVSHFALLYMNTIFHISLGT